MSYQQELLDLIAPEYLSLPHELRLYQGLEETGETSLERARENGFYRVAKANDERPALFLHESQFEVFGQLILEVSRLRRLQEDAEDEGTEPEEDLEDVDAEVSFDEDVEMLPETFDAEHLTLTTEQWKIWFATLWPACQPFEEARPLLGDEASFAKPEEVLRCYYLSVSHAADEVEAEVVPDSTEGAWGCDVETLKASIVETFHQRLEGLKALCEQRLVWKENERAIGHFFFVEIRERWRKKQTVWDKKFVFKGDVEASEKERWELLRSQIFTSHEKDAYKWFRGYRGKLDVDAAKERLLGYIEACDEALQTEWKRRKHRRLFKKQYKEMSTLASQFPLARQMKREWIFYCGPTNSGKSYSAFEALAAEQTGVYLAPLRLLAMEGQRELQARGKKTSLMTGEERDIVEGAVCISSTIEMLNPERVVGAAVIDEIQLLAHPQRGWAWFHALFGAPASKLILTGSKYILPLVKQCAEYLQEPLKVIELERFTSLTCLEEPSELLALEPGTAVICFSRRDVLALKRKIESAGNQRVAVIYGGLPPEVRRREAARFRNGEAELLVATDAIGYGLNLPIKTVLFWSVDKVSAGIKRPLMAAEAQQIAGRAGRYGLHEAGFVGAFEEEHLEVVQELLQERMHPPHGPYGIPPSLEHLKLLSSCLESNDLPELLRYYRREAWFDEPFLVPFVPEQMLVIAEELEPVIEEAPLTLKYAFSLAPIPTKFKRLLREHKRLAKAYVEGKPWAFPLSQLHPYFADYSENERQLYLAEEQSQRLTLYSWLAHRFPERFVAGEDAETFRAIVERFLSRSLSKGIPIKRCRRCGVKLAPFYRFQVCQPCHHGKTFYQ